MVPSTTDQQLHRKYWVAALSVDTRFTSRVGICDSYYRLYFLWCFALDLINLIPFQGFRVLRIIKVTVFQEM